MSTPIRHFLSYYFIHVAVAQSHSLDVRAINDSPYHRIIDAGDPTGIVPDSISANLRLPEIGADWSWTLGRWNIAEFVQTDSEVLAIRLGPWSTCIPERKFIIRHCKLVH